MLVLDRCNVLTFLTSLIIVQFHCRVRRQGEDTPARLIRLTSRIEGIIYRWKMALKFRQETFFAVFIFSGLAAIESQQSGGRFVWQTFCISVDCVSGLLCVL